MIPLASWLARHDRPRPLCRRGEELVDSARFVQDVARLAAALDGRERGRRLLCTESAYACAVGLFALWQHGSVAVLPPNLEAGTLRELAEGTCGRLVDDVASEVAGAEDGTLALLGRPPCAPRSARELDPASVAVLLCTSGSTGARKVVPKTLLQLQSEIEALEREFGATLGDARVFGTVSFQHIYGLLFRVLWPLCAGRVFADATAVDPAHVERAFDGPLRGVLVGSPAHLKRLPELLDLARLAPACVQVFSSGGALDGATAARFERELGSAPLEVLGSTETGGIAWRRQGARGGPAWQPFPGVRVEVHDGLLLVHSLPAGGEGGVATGDAVELLADGRFLLSGRTDRIVKLFDERVSLADLEARLAAHPAVHAAGATVLERGGTPRLAAAVVLSPAGVERLGAEGKSALVAALRAHLGDFFRATAVPRAWRFVERLPEDAQGKVGVRALQALFEDATPSLAARLVARVEDGASALELELEVPPDLWCLRGHFEGFPVVPGVVQLQWVLEWASQWLGAEQELRGVEALKFKQLLAGGARFRLRLERTGNAAKLRFRLWNEQGEFSSGRVFLAAGSA